MTCIVAELLSTEKCLSPKLFPLEGEEFKDEGDDMAADKGRFSSFPMGAEHG
jgi:hypothetical protein